MYLKLRALLYPKVYVYILLAYCFLIPVLPKFTPPLTIIFLLFLLVEGKFKERFQIFTVEKFRGWFLLPIVFFLCNCIRFVFSNGNVHTELFDIQKKLFLFVLPLCFSLVPLSLFTRERLNKYLRFYIYGFLVYMIYALARAFYVSYFKGVPPAIQFFYSNLSGSSHPSYVSLFGIFALLFCLYLKEQEAKKLFKFILNLFILVISIFIIMLSSRAGLISLILVITLYIAYIIWKKRKYLQALLLLLLFILLGVITSREAELVKSRYEYTIEKIEEISTQKGNDIRIVLWEASLAGISQNFWVGVGTDKINEVLTIESKKQDENAEILDLNPHNQFLQSFLALGVVGFLSLLSCFILPVVLGFRYKCYLLILFSFIVGFNNLFESMFERHAGNLFFGFFFCFFILQCFAKQKEIDLIK